MRIALASASPRRRDILETLGHDVVVAPVEVDELPLAGEVPAPYLERVVSDKLAAARARPWCTGAFALLVADTIVVLDGEILLKPDARQPDEDARRMIRKLSGRGHQVTTRFAICTSSGLTHEESVTTSVFFRPLAADEIEAYAESGEGRDKAGAYAIQGRGAGLVVRIDGSYGAVVGLPASEVAVALRRLAFA